MQVRAARLCVRAFVSMCACCWYTPEAPAPKGIWFSNSISLILGFQWLPISLGDFPKAKFPRPVPAPCPLASLSFSLPQGWSEGMKL